MASKDQAKAAAAEAETVEPRPAPDPRLRVLKKFRGKFLPKGPLRDRYKILIERWESNGDHGGVTYEELKGLLEDWRTVKARKRRPTVQN
ncbi:hypothetical protein BH23PLA1_BH23PLA1_00800 [soil metagenome]